LLAYVTYKTYCVCLAAYEPTESTTQENNPLKAGDDEHLHVLTTPDEAEAASVLVGMQFASYDSAAGTPHSLGVGISSLPVEPYPSYGKLKLENLLLRNENMKLTSVKKCTERKYFSTDDVKDNDTKCKFYTGLCWRQFLCLWNFLGPATNKLTYCDQPQKLISDKSPSKRVGPRRKLQPIDELFL